MKFLMVVLLTILVQSKGQASCKAHDEFTLITNTVEKNFYDKTMKGLDWPELKRKYQSTLTCIASDQQISKTINQLLNHLNTSHTVIFTPQDIEYWSLKSIFSGDLKKFPVPFSGIHSEKFSDGTFVKYVLEGSPAHQQSIGPGDKLESINGNPFSDLGFSVNTYSNLTWSMSPDNSFHADIKPNTASMQSHYLKASRTSQYIKIKNRRSVGYFHLWSGTHEAFLKALEKSLRFFKSRRVKAIVIDLRDGHGGANPDYLKLLQTDKFLKAIPKYFLINNGVVSGKEWIAAIIKRDRLGVLVGTKTAGAFMAGAPFDLLDGRFFLYLAVKEFLPPGIPKIEGIGIEPDIIVQPCLKFCHNEDPQLKKAFDLAFSL